MSEQEHFCQLCGVHFNLARIRRIDEPLSLETAWDKRRPPWPPLKDSTVKSRSYIRVEKRSEPHPACTAAGCSNADNDHAAGGPDCDTDNGYNGWRISLQEMDRITRVKRLVLKPRGVRGTPPEGGIGGLEYESEDWCVTGVSRGYVDRHRALNMLRSRGIGGNVSMCNDNTDYRMAIGLHPSFFEVYKRVCMKKKGRVDIDRIAKFRNLCSSVSATYSNLCLLTFQYGERG